MAQFTVRGRVKPLFNGDGLSVGFEVTGTPLGRRFKVVRGGCRGVHCSEAPCSSPLQLQELKRRFSGARSISTTRVYANASSSSIGKSNKFRLNDQSNGMKEEVWEEIIEETEFEKDELSTFRGLVLDISYRPVNVVCWKRAICLEFMEKVVKRRRIKKALSRKNIFYRDSYMCQYCSSDENLTIDHVLPIARGGEWTWENLVTACSRCNSRKGHKTPEEANMKLMKEPKAPKEYEILAIPLTSSAIKMLRSKKGTPEEWRQYLSMPSAAP